MNPVPVSFIVPVYNVRDYVRDCLESIAAQTFPHFECIVVDDGSTDGSGEICDDFCREDKRFRVIHQKNAGLGFARNTGLDNAAGTCVQFVDSDDTVLPDMLESALALIRSGPYDWVSFGFSRVGLTGEALSSMPENQENETGDVHERRIDALYRLLFFGPDLEQLLLRLAWNKLFSRKFIGNLRFAVACYNEDHYFMYQIVKKTRRSAHIDRKLYLWRQRPDSITHASADWDVFGVFPGYVYMLNASEPCDKTALRGFLLQFLYRKMLVIRYRSFGTAYYAGFMKTCRAIRKDTLAEYVFRKEIPLWERLAIVSVWPFPHLGRFLFKLIGN